MATTQPRTLTALGKGRRVYEYVRNGDLHTIRLGSIDDHEARSNAKPKTKADREALDADHPPRSVKLLGEDWAALWQAQRPVLQAEVKAGDIQVTTGDVVDLDSE